MKFNVRTDIDPKLDIGRMNEDSSTYKELLNDFNNSLFRYSCTHANSLELDGDTGCYKCSKCGTVFKIIDLPQENILGAFTFLYNIIETMKVQYAVCPEADINFLTELRPLLIKLPQAYKAINNKFKEQYTLAPLVEDANKAVNAKKETLNPQFDNEKGPIVGTNPCIGLPGTYEQWKHNNEIINRENLEHAFTRIIEEFKTMCGENFSKKDILDFKKRIANDLLLLLDNINRSSYAIVDEVDEFKTLINNPGKIISKDFCDFLNKEFNIPYTITTVGRNSYIIKEIDLDDIDSDI